MLDIKYLSKLLEILKSSNVHTYKFQSLEITFDSPLPKEIEPKKVVEPSLPHVPDLKADDTMSVDQILHWSSSPEPGEGMPLTGDEPL